MDGGREVGRARGRERGMGEKRWYSTPQSVYNTPEFRN